MLLAKVVYSLSSFVEQLLAAEWAAETADAETADAETADAETADAETELIFATETDFAADQYAGNILMPAHQYIVLAILKLR